MKQETKRKILSFVRKILNYDEYCVNPFTHISHSDQKIEIINFKKEIDFYDFQENQEKVLDRMTYEFSKELNDYILTAHVVDEMTQKVHVKMELKLIKPYTYFFYKVKQ